MGDVNSRYVILTYLRRNLRLLTRKRKAWGNLVTYLLKSSTANVSLLKILDYGGIFWCFYGYYISTFIFFFLLATKCSIFLWFSCKLFISCLFYFLLLFHIFSDLYIFHLSFSMSAVSHIVLCHFFPVGFLSHLAIVALTFY